jgi:hypothetical protein
MINRFQSSMMQTILHKAVIANSFLLASGILHYSSTYQGKDKTAQLVNMGDESRGWTCVHYCVKANDYGSHENLSMLELLVAHGADLNQKDKQRTLFVE